MAATEDVLGRLLRLAVHQSADPTSERRGERVKLWVRWSEQAPELLAGEQALPTDASEGGEPGQWTVDFSVPIYDDNFAQLRFEVAFTDQSVFHGTLDYAVVDNVETDSLTPHQHTVPLSPRDMRLSRADILLPSPLLCSVSWGESSLPTLTSSSSEDASQQPQQQGETDILPDMGNLLPAELNQLFRSLKIAVLSASGLRPTKQRWPVYLKTQYLRHTDPPLKFVVSRSQLADDPINPVVNWRGCYPVVELSASIVVKFQGWRRGIKDPRVGYAQIAISSLVGRSIDEPFDVPITGRSRRGKVCGGSVRIAAQVGPPVFDAARMGEFLGPHPAEQMYRALPNLEQHDIRRGITGLANFRDVGAGWPISYFNVRTNKMRSGRMKTGVLFRTSALHRANAADARLLLDELGVRDFLDLRTPDVAGNRGPFLSQRVSVMSPSFRGHVYKRFTGWEYVKHANHDSLENGVTLLKSAAVIGSEPPSSTLLTEHTSSSGMAPDEVARLYQVGLVGSKFNTEVVKLSSLRSLLRCGIALKDKDAQKMIICTPIFNKPNGLEILYEMFVDFCKFEILLVFNTLLHTASLPVVFFCNHGKDRTGLIAALIQAMCGVDHETIFDGYCLSEFLLYPIQHIVDREMTTAGMAPEIMSPTPRRTIVHTFNYIQQNFGGIPAYLEHIGFSLDNQTTLRNRFVDWD